MVSRAQVEQRSMPGKFSPALCITYCSSEKPGPASREATNLSTINEAQQYLNQGLLRDDGEKRYKIP